MYHPKILNFVCFIYCLYYNGMIITQWHTSVALLDLLKNPKAAYGTYWVLHV